MNNEGRVTRNDDGSEMPDIMEGEVRSALRSLKKGKAPGIDGISAELLQAGDEHIVTALHPLFNAVQEQEQIPEDWGKTIITPSTDDLVATNDDEMPDFMEGK